MSEVSTSSTSGEAGKLKETERVVAGPGPGRSPFGGGIVGQKASSFKPSAKRLLNRMRPQRVKLALVLLTAPLGMIGVALFLLLCNQPFGFVSLLGTIALAGMIMRNSVILVDQIDQDIAAGHAAWDTVIDATVRRARPILLTAGTAIFAMIPLSRSVFWGPMAVALMGGLLVATALTLLFLPALYAAWFRVKRPMAEAAPQVPHAPPALALAAE